jgi:hypothetical protein
VALVALRSSRWVRFGCCLAALAACSPEVQIADAESSMGGNSSSAGAAGGGAQPNGGTAGVGGTSGTESGAGAPEGGASDVPNDPPRLLADSVADFSLTQGLHGWYYGIDSGDIATFTQMGRQSTITAYKPPSGDTWNCWASDTTHWAQLFQLGGHPNGTKSSDPSTNLLERAVRRWRSTYEGRVLITGELAKIDLTVEDSNGIEGKVLIDGVEAYSKVIEAVDGGGVAYSIEAAVRVDSTIDFVLDPHEGDDHHDLTRFTAVIAIAPDSK